VLQEYAPTGRLKSEWPLDHAASWMTADAHENAYLITDCVAICIEKLRAGRVLATWKLPPDSRVVSDGPMAVDTRGNVYVTELLPSLAYAIQRITPTARPGQVTITRIGSISWSRLTAIAVDRRGNLYIPEQDQNRIQTLSPTGKVLATSGRRGSRAGQFHQPAGIAVDPRGALYVTDTGNSRIQKLSGSSNETFQLKGQASPLRTTEPSPVTSERGVHSREARSLRVRRIAFGHRIIEEIGQETGGE
jgi:streptogramin lyase